MTAHDKSVGRLVPYNDKTKEQQQAFWLHKSRWNVAVGKELFSPLKKAVRIVDALIHPKWGSYLQGMFAVAAHSTWTNRLQYKDPEDIFLVDRTQIYTDIRAAPDLIFGNRPPLSEVPIHHGGILDRGRRDTREPNVEGFTQVDAVLGPEDIGDAVSDEGDDV